MKKWICLLMILTCFLSGLCFDEDKTDPFFAYPNQQAGACTLSAPDDFFAPADWCMSEQLGVRSVSADLLAAVQNGVRYCVKTAVFISLPELPPENSSFLLAMTYAKEHAKHPQAVTVIMDYIHSKDGEKA